MTQQVLIAKLCAAPGARDVFVVCVKARGVSCAVPTVSVVVTEVSLRYKCVAEEAALGADLAMTT